MSYVTVDVVVNGALEESLNFTDETVMREFIGVVEDEAKDHGYPTEVYALYHDHPEELDCECAQYVTDHHPQYSYNQEDE